MPVWKMVRNYALAALGIALLVLTVVKWEWVRYSLWGSGALPTKIASAVTWLGGAALVYLFAQWNTRRNVYWYADEHRKSLIEEISVLREQLAEARRDARKWEKLAGERAAEINQAREILGRVGK